jgi:hypothetical protein
MVMNFGEDDLRRGGDRERETGGQTSKKNFHALYMVIHSAWIFKHQGDMKK